MASAPSKARRRSRRYSPLLSPALLLTLWCSGFWMGQVSAPSAAPLPTPSAPPPRLTATLAPSPTPTAEPLPTATPAPTPEPTPTPSVAEEWYLRLVNRDNPLPEDFAIPELSQLPNGYSMDSRVYPHLMAMLEDARSAGYSPVVCSAYRSREKQEELYTRKVESYLDQGLSQDEAEAQAALWVMPPDTSEHQMGLAADIVDLDYQILDEAQEDRPVQQWLMAHCAEYGFILRYPTDKSDITGVSYEPWHYRYVGVETAREITESGLCLEEYLETLKK